MSLLTDLIAKQESDLLVTLALVDGGEDSLDIQDGLSTLTPEAIARQKGVLDDQKDRRDSLVISLSALKQIRDKGHDSLKSYDVEQAVIDEINLKQRQMADFSSLLRPIVIGADSLVVTERN
jgi:hypothetical protein